MADRRDQLRSFTAIIARPVPATVLISGLAIIALIAILTTKPPSSPERALRGFISARLAGNEATAAKLTVQGNLDDFLGAEYSLSGTGASFNVSVSQSGSEDALVVAHYTWQDQTMDVPYACIRVSGEWKIDLEGTEQLWMEGESGP